MNASYIVVTWPYYIVYLIQWIFILQVKMVILHFNQILGKNFFFDRIIQTSQERDEVDVAAYYHSTHAIYFRNDQISYWTIF